MLSNIGLLQVLKLESFKVQDFENSRNADYCKRCLWARCGSLTAANLEKSEMPMTPHAEKQKNRKRSVKERKIILEGGKGLKVVVAREKEAKGEGDEPEHII